MNRNRSRRRVSRHFPDYGWAWPRGEHDQLLKAVLLADDAAALGAARAWLDGHNVDKASFREHRLLAAVSQRFGSVMTGDAAYPRLVGLQRHLWAKSQIAIREARPVLAALAAAMPMMLIKGASRVAVDPAAATGRVANDIDLLVKPTDMAAAFEIITGQGWQPSNGASALYLATQLRDIRSLNLFAGRFGDLDLHQAAYHPANPKDADDSAFWGRAEVANFHGISVLVPSVVDRAALAIDYGSLDAHVHSDWLVDCVVALRTPAFAWTAFATTIDHERLTVPAAIVLSYVAQEIGVVVPGELLDSIIAAADRAGAERVAVMLQAKPRHDQGPISTSLRRFAKLWRNRHVRRGKEAPQQVLSGRRIAATRSSTAQSSLSFATRHALPIPTTISGATQISVTVRIAAPTVARRIEMEINGSRRHIARLRFRTLRPRLRPLVVSFKGTIWLKIGDGSFTLEARPIRQLRETELPAKAARFGALPFQLLALDSEPSPSNNRV